MNADRFPLFLPDGVKPTLGERLIRRLVGLDAAAATFAGFADGASDVEFLQRAMVHFGYASLVQTPAASLAKVPVSGGLLAVANHPSGLLDGLLALHQLLQVRQDVLVLGNQFLRQIPSLQRWLVPTVESRNRESTHRVRALLKVRRHLRNGGCVLAFPAGTVAHFHGPTLRIREAPWSPVLFQVCAENGAEPAPRVLPIRLHLKNRRRYHLIAAISRTARTSLLLREMLAHRPVASAIEFLPPLSEHSTPESLCQSAYQAVAKREWLSR